MKPTLAKGQNKVLNAMIEESKKIAGKGSLTGG